MPAGMMLKSDGFASNLSAPGTEGTLAAYCARTARVSRHAPPREPRPLRRVRARLPAALRSGCRGSVRLDGRADREGFTLSLDDGEILTADLVVVATGITTRARTGRARRPSSGARHAQLGAQRSGAIRESRRNGGRSRIVGHRPRDASPRGRRNDTSGRPQRAPQVLVPQAPIHEADGSG